MFKLEFGTDNAAFEYREAETARILREIAGWIVHGKTTDLLHDINGNIIGRYELTQAPHIELGETSAGSCRLTDIVAGISHLLPAELIDEFDLYDENEPDDREAQAGIFEEICDHLNEIAPKGLSFGTSEGDRARYGFWKYEEGN